MNRFQVWYRWLKGADWTYAGGCEWGDQADSIALTLLEDGVNAVWIERGPDA